MKTLKKKNLDELAQCMPVITEKEQKRYIGGGLGDSDNPYTWEMAEWMMDNGYWTGGYVEGRGYCFAEAVVTGNSSGNSGSSSEFWDSSGNTNWGSGMSGSSCDHGSGCYGCYTRDPVNHPVEIQMVPGIINPLEGGIPEGEVIFPLMPNFLPLPNDWWPI